MPQRASAPHPGPSRAPGHVAHRPIAPMAVQAPPSLSQADPDLQIRRVVSETTRRATSGNANFATRPICDQERSVDYCALADKLRQYGELERAGPWQNVAASYARCAMRARLGAPLKLRVRRAWFNCTLCLAGPGHVLPLGFGVKPALLLAGEFEPDLLIKQLFSIGGVWSSSLNIVCQGRDPPSARGWLQTARRQRVARRRAVVRRRAALAQRQ